jgi:hypothetical protein
MDIGVVEVGRGWGSRRVGGPEVVGVVWDPEV